ncbi:uncharacterized protein LOC135398684 [Ornithodoros turicata]|uniref:uncharacterized protein LOC135398684 n=1 Tax=Ornithodoros turicata TaxID=34597 RepID=UPI0031389790
MTKVTAPPKTPPQYPNRPFQWLVFSVQWVTGFCKTTEGAQKCDRQKLQKLGKQWAIHGLWPDGPHGPPTYCNCSVGYDPGKLTALYGDMNKYWTSVARGAQEGFWKHEWDKHGTCALKHETLGGIANYFKGAIDLRKRFDGLLGRLHPGTVLQPLSSIKDALNVYPGSVSLVCGHAQTGQNRILHELQFSMNMSLQPHLQKNKFGENGCAPSVLFPAS